MKITAVKLYTLENPARPSRVLKLGQVPNLRRIQPPGWSGDFDNCL